MVEAHEILELFCELLGGRMELIKSCKDCPMDMQEAVYSLIYAADRTEIPELKEVKKQFKKKYGKEFVERGSTNFNGCVNERIVDKLSIYPPNKLLVKNYLSEIAKAHNVDWQPEDASVDNMADQAAPMPAPTGYSVQAGTASGMDQAGVYGVVHAPTTNALTMQCTRCQMVLSAPPGAAQFLCPCGNLMKVPVVAAAAPGAMAVALNVPTATELKQDDGAGWQGGAVAGAAASAGAVASGFPGYPAGGAAAAGGGEEDKAPAAFLDIPAAPLGQGMAGAGGSAAGPDPRNGGSDDDSMSGGAGGAAAGGGGGTDFDDLQARFAALQRNV